MLELQSFDNVTIYTALIHFNIVIHSVGAANAHLPFAYIIVIP